MCSFKAEHVGSTLHSPLTHMRTTDLCLHTSMIMTVLCICLCTHKLKHAEITVYVQNERYITYFILLKNQKEKKEVQRVSTHNRTQHEMHFTKYMALKIDIESTTINARVHKNTWEVNCAIVLKFGSYQVVITPYSIIQQKCRSP